MGLQRVRHNWSDLTEFSVWTSWDHCFPQNSLSCKKQPRMRSTDPSTAALLPSNPKLRETHLVWGAKIHQEWNSVFGRTTSCCRRGTSGNFSPTAHEVYMLSRIFAFTIKAYQFLSLHYILSSITWHNNRYEIETHYNSNNHTGLQRPSVLNSSPTVDKESRVCVCVSTCLKVKV